MGFGCKGKRVLQSPQAGRNSTELLNLTITEISFTKTRRVNRNAQGSLRSRAQGAEESKTNKRDRMNEPP